MSASDDDRFEPRLGRIRSLGDRRAKSFLSRMSEKVSRLGGPPRLSIGYGHRNFGGRQQAMSYSRRVIVKARIVRLTPTGISRQAAHLSYIQRDGVDRDGSAARLYDARTDDADGAEFSERSEGDRHQFRFIVSAEDGQEFASLKPFIRDLMATAERDLDTKLDWVAADHFDTDHPHTHIIVRGKTDRGDDLVIPRAYISHGLRQRAMELASLELGPETAVEAFRKQTREVDQERFTRLDRRLLSAAHDHVVTLDRYDGESALFAARLRSLRKMGLAESQGGKHWTLSHDLETTVRRMGERGDIIKTLHRTMKRAGLSRPVGPNPQWAPGRASEVLEGRLVSLGIADEITDRAFAVVDGLDGRVRYADLGAPAPLDARVGDLIRITTVSIKPRAVDRTIAAIAEDAGGRYDVALHTAHEPRARPEFIQAHLRRLEALRRVGIAQRAQDGIWTIPGDYAERAKDYDRSRSAKEPARLAVIGREPVDTLARMNAATWLDERLAGDAEDGVADAGFGHDVREALQARRLWLVRQGLMKTGEPGEKLAPEGLEELKRRELDRLGGAIWREMRLPYAPAREGERIEGTYVRAEVVASGKVAVIARAKDFTLVPWRDVLERNLGKRVSGVMGGVGVSWDLTRNKGIGR